MIAVRLPSLWVPVAVGALSLALATREISHISVLVPVAAGAVGLLVPTTTERGAPLVPSLAVAVCGMAAFALSASAWSEPAHIGSTALAASLVAAVGEEAFFRRGAYAWLARWGAPVAITGSALAFALVHVSMYGWGAAAVDLAAGLVFSWQRWATGRWSVSAATHAFANLVASI